MPTDLMEARRAAAAVRDRRDRARYELKLTESGYGPVCARLLAGDEAALPLVRAAEAEIADLVIAVRRAEAALRALP